MNFMKKKNSNPKNPFEMNKDIILAYFGENN